MIKVENLSFSYQDHNDTIKAIDDISFEIKSGEFIGIVGHNGSGKSTLIKLICGLLLPEKGQVFIDEINSKELIIKNKVGDLIGVVFQNPDNQIVATIVENDVAFGPENKGLPSDVILARVEEALRLVDMEDFRFKSPNMLSGGQKQRLAVAGILALGPKCIIFDEPTAMLDPQGADEVLALAKKLCRKEGKTIIYITHFMEELLEADKIFILEKGQLSGIFSPEELFKKGNFLKKYKLEQPEIFRLISRLRANSINLPWNLKTEKDVADKLCQ